MATRSKLRQARSLYRNIDDGIKLLTGKRLKSILGTAMNLFGEDLAKKAAAHVFSVTPEPESDLDCAYKTLGVHREAHDVVVKGAFRALAREYHPDTGSRPDTAKFQAAQEAYSMVMAARQTPVK